LAAMQWEDTIRFAWWALSTEKLKAALTMLGVVIGSAAIVMVVTIAIVGKTYVLSLIEGIGTNLVYATLDRSGHTTAQDEITLDDLESIRTDLPYVSAAAGVLDRPVYVYVSGRSMRVSLVGVTEDFQKIRKLRIPQGRYFDATDFSARDHVCLVSKPMNDDVFGGRGLGQVVKVQEFTCTIIGVFEEGVPTFGRSEIQEDTVLLPYALMRNLVGESFVEVIYAQASTTSEVGELTSDIQGVLNSRHRAQARYTVENLAGLLRTADKVSKSMTWTLLGLAALTLTVAGSGIMNIMLVNVAERTREIGVRMAIGARPSEIRMQFLLEAVFISLGGALVGVIGAVAAIWAASIASNAEGIRVSWVGVLCALFVATSVGVIFGYRPASEASKLSPVEALRT
jgi:putative ABC transport system permease protein